MVAMTEGTKRARILANLNDPLKMIQWNDGMVFESFAYRASFQHKNNPKVPDYDYDLQIPLLQRTGVLAQMGIDSPFTQVNLMSWVRLGQKHGIKLSKI